MTTVLPCTTGCGRAVDSGGLFCSSCARKLYIGDRHSHYEIVWFLKWLLILGVIGSFLGALTRMVVKAHADAEFFRVAKQSLTDDQYVEFSRDYDTMRFQ